MSSYERQDVMAWLQAMRAARVFLTIVVTMIAAILYTRPEEFEPTLPFLAGAAVAWLATVLSSCRARIRLWKLDK